MDLDKTAGQTGAALPIGAWEGATRHVATKSALTPLQWGLGIVGVFSAPISILAPMPMNYLAFGLFAICALSFLGLFIFAFLFRTHLVQSEEYRLEERRIELLGDDKNHGAKVIDVAPIPNPHEQIPLLLTGVTAEGENNE